MRNGYEWIQKDFLESAGIFSDRISLEKMLTLHQEIDDIPLNIAGILYEFSTQEPEKYFNRIVASEVFLKLNNLFKENNEKFLTGFESAVKYYSLALKAYDYTMEIYKEYSKFPFDSRFKTNIFRIPMYLKLSEGHLYKIDL
ncbi:Calcineurin-like phosphoesterase family protein [Leptospira santarosai]|uniref:Calcineurin-like phosphoesterase family protein n=1 Tax=Leptospira santarosai TaxID=28183 RepID=A0A2P1QY84_9LEPT|nr:Calcineurin-like phosphoesterase family protein [Leptospira santarosai]